MTRRFRLLALPILFTTVALTWPAEVAAQRAVPRGGGGRVGVAVPRGYSHSQRYNRPYSYRSYSYRPHYYARYGSPYYYSRNYYPYYGGYPYYAYSPYYYPYYPRYYAPWYYGAYPGGFGYGIGFGIGFGVGFGWSGAYAAPSNYANPYPAEYWSDGSGRMRTPSPNVAQPVPTVQPADPGPVPSYAPRAAERYAVQATTATPRSASSSTATESREFGTLTLRVNPPTAEVVIDGQVWDRPAAGESFSVELSEGSHRIELREQGYGSYVRTIDIVGGRTFTLNVGLPRGGVAPVSTRPYAAPPTRSSSTAWSRQ